MTGISDLQKDVDDLKAAAQLLRGVSGTLDGKAAMINDGFSKLVEAKALMDSKITEIMATVKKLPMKFTILESNINDSESILDEIKENLSKVSGALDAGKKLKQDAEDAEKEIKQGAEKAEKEIEKGNVMGGLNDLKKEGLGKFGF